MRPLHPIFPILLLITGIFLWRAEVGLFGLHFVVAGLFSFIFTLKTNEDEN